LSVSSTVARLSVTFLHAKDCVLTTASCTDLTFVPILEALLPKLTCKTYIILTDEKHMPKACKLNNPLCYETLVRKNSADFTWPTFSTPAVHACCPSHAGFLRQMKTPRRRCVTRAAQRAIPRVGALRLTFVPHSVTCAGVLYSHRSTVIHAMAACAPDSLNIAAADSILVIVPLFHANAWAIPYSAASCGAKIVFPGSPDLTLNALCGAANIELIALQAPTWTAKACTICSLTRRSPSLPAFPPSGACVFDDDNVMVTDVDLTAPVPLSYRLMLFEYVDKMFGPTTRVSSWPAVFV
jgi:hypothetical protein